MTTPRDPWRSWARYAALIAVLVVATLVLGWLPPRPHGDSATLTSWQYRYLARSDVPGAVLSPLDDAWNAPGWTPITLPGHPPAGDGTLWLRTRLPERAFADPTVAFNAVLGPFEAYLDRPAGLDALPSRIHVYPTPEGLDARGPPGLPWQLVRLPADAAGRTLSLRIAADYRPGGVKGTPIVGARADLVSAALERDVPRLAIGFVAFLLGAFGVVAFGGRSGWRLPVGYAVAVTTLGAYIVNYTHVKDLLFDAPLFWFLWWAAALLLNPIGALLFLDELFGTGPRGILRWLLRIHVGFLVLAVVVDAFAWWLMLDLEHRTLGVVIFTWRTNALRLLLVVSSVVALVRLVRRSVDGDTDARIFLVGFSVHFAFVARDVLASVGVASLSWKSGLHVGVLALVVSAALVLQRRHEEVHRKAAERGAEIAVRVREKEILLRDLHDGIGALTSNVRMLAELGQRRTDRAQKALGTIAELSAKTLAELRAFVQTLDDDGASWEHLAAELRRFGATVVEAHGRTWSMQARIDTAPPPSSVVALHLFRIVSEALTNALKQTDGTFVAVDLRIVPDALTLVVENDGGKAARSGSGVDAGKGLGNLRARATELGGSFETDFGDVVRLKLEVPLPLKSPEAAAVLRVAS